MDLYWYIAYGVHLCNNKHIFKRTNNKSENLAYWLPICSMVEVIEQSDDVNEVQDPTELPDEQDKGCMLGIIPAWPQPFFKGAL